MAKLRFLWNNLIDQGVVDASSEDPEFPAENVQHELFLKAWRAAGIAEWLCVDLSSSGILDKSVRAWAIKYHNLEFVSGDDYRVQASAADLCGSGVPSSGEVDVPFVPTPDIIVGFFAAAQTFDSWKFLLDSSGSKGAGEYQRIGRLFLGNYFEPKYDVTISPAVAETDDSEVLKSEQGQEYANVETPYEVIDYLWRALPAADIAAMKGIYRAVGRHSPFFICEDADDPAGAYTRTRYVKNVDSWLFSPVVHGWGSVLIRVKTER